MVVDYGYVTFETGFIMPTMAKAPKRTSKPKRSGVSIQLYVEPDTRLALDNFIAAQRLKPSITETIEVAIQDFLMKEGFYPPKKEGDEEADEG